MLPDSADPFAKIEGLTVVGSTLAVINDNDFDVDEATDETPL